MRTSVIAAIVLLSIFVGCKQPTNLQPLIAVAGTYALIEHAKKPVTPPPAPTGCTKGCKCNGTGREPTGDGLSDSDCRCPDDCACKRKPSPTGAVKATGPICTTGTCAGWPPRNIKR